MKTLSQLNVSGKRAVVRVDYNLPMSDGAVTDDTRVVASLPTLQHLLDSGASLVLLSHLGRPKGEVNEKYSLAPVAKVLEGHLGRSVKFVDALPSSEEALRAAQALQAGEVLLLQNVRFEATEEKNGEELAEKLAQLGDVFVLDAFGAAHRAHASVSGIAAHLPSAAGKLLEREATALGRLLDAPEKPYVVIVGGAKVSDKIKVIEALLPKVDKLLIGGGMAYTFIKAQGGSIGNSIVELDQVDYARGLLEAHGDKIMLPLDNVIADDFSNDANIQIVDAGSIPDGWEGLDVGPKTIAAYTEALQSAKTVFWNGPLGVFEFSNFAKGTNSIAAAVADLQGAYTVVGGGDSVSAINKSGRAGAVSHVSTGGGASLELLEGKTLPGLAAMQ